MPAITALLHTENDALRLGRCLETLYPCDEIVIVDHGSRDATVQIAREYGARVVEALPGTGFEFDARQVGLSRNNLGKWILCLDPCESVSESLAASLFEWKSAGDGTAAALPAISGPAISVPAITVSAITVSAISVFVREEGAKGWVENPVPQIRLVPWDWDLWQGRFPRNGATAATLEGHLLRFDFP